MVPRAIRLTSRPERPKCAYVISSVMPRAYVPSFRREMPCQGAPISPEGVRPPGELPLRAGALWACAGWRPYRGTPPPPGRIEQDGVERPAPARDVGGEGRIAAQGVDGGLDLALVDVAVLGESGVQDRGQHLTGEGGRRPASC